MRPAQPLVVQVSDSHRAAALPAAQHVEPFREFFQVLGGKFDRAEVFSDRSAPRPQRLRQQGQRGSAGKEHRAQQCRPHGPHRPSGRSLSPIGDLRGCLCPGTPPPALILGTYPETATMIF